VPRLGRNDPCPCGSGRKVKRCCGQQRGPAQDQVERAFIAQHARQAASEIGALPRPTLRDLWDSLVELPDLDLSLVITLPTLISPELDELLQAAIDDDLDRAEDVMPAVLDAVDTPEQRARLAHAIIELRDSGRLPTRQAAAAIIDLDSRSQTLIRASLINAVFIKTGRIHTPGGLRLAA
jgi:SEC-C motif